VLGAFPTGVVRLAECADAATAALVARDPRTAADCHLLGDRHLAVPAEHDVAFRRGLVHLGYALPRPPSGPEHRTAMPTGEQLRREPGGVPGSAAGHLPDPMGGSVR